MSLWRIFADFFFPLHLPGITNLATIYTIYPIIATIAHLRHYPDNVTGSILSLAGAGRFAIAIPTALVYPIIGLPNTLMLGTIIAQIGVTLGSVYYEGVYGLSAAVLLMSCGVGMIGNARMPFIYALAPPGHLGSMNSVAAGAGRWSQIIGPLAATTIMHYYDPRVALALNSVLLLVALASMYFSLNVLNEGAAKAAANDAAGGATKSIVHTLQALTHRCGDMIMLIIACVTMGTLNGARFMIIPVVALRLHMDSLQVGSLITASYIIDALFFWISGPIMDSKGRRWSMAPCQAMFAIAFVLLGTATTIPMVYTAVVVMGFAVSVGSGSLSTVMADVIPKDAGTTAYILLRSIPDGSTMIGPLLMGYLLHHTDLYHTCVVFATIGALGCCFTIFAPIFNKTDAPHKKQESGPKTTEHEMLLQSKPDYGTAADASHNAAVPVPESH